VDFLFAYRPTVYASTASAVGSEFCSQASGNRFEVSIAIGTSGWQYADWRKRFYPDGLAQSRWLEYYASKFDTVEVNNSFYRLPSVQTFASWRRATPTHFTFSVKASRYLTHVLRLRDPIGAVGLLMERASALEGKLGPILLQLPANFPKELDRLDDTLKAFPPEARVAFEPRHASWFDPSVFELLHEHGAALCLSDRRGPAMPLQRTASWGYIRFHEGRATPAPCYGKQALDTWADRIARMWPGRGTVYAYFNNDQGGCALRDARSFAHHVTLRAMRPSRVPDRGDIRL
jgi:uncharacterized protein YecE (DUF72 family)